VQVSLTPQGASTASLTFDEDSNLNNKHWQSLPALDNYQKLGSLRPAATTLLNIETGRETLPLLISQPYGKGQSFILATGGTWRWQMSLPADDQSHKTFWRQLMRTLVIDTPEQMSFTVKDEAGELKLVAEIRDENYEPITDARIVAVISSDSTSAVDSASSGIELTASPTIAGQYEARVKAERSGTYYIDAIASKQNKPLTAARVAIYRSQTNAEAFGIRQNRAQLERLAEATGGSYWTDESINDLPTAIEGSSAGIVERLDYPLWSMPIIFLVLVLLKISEWLLRRRWGHI
jgi:hypothetical protein